MKTLEEMKRILAEHKHELYERYHVQSIGIFGSYVRGDQKSKSDVDILVDFDKPMGWEIVDLHEYLEKILAMKVDLVTKGAVIRKPLLWKSIQEDLINV
ncbi:MAG: nucleotidyltransferase family protein [Deltaproteobacteria bacterium]|nr:nucleotidyltransferase family protein [Deltaproteobacteria bacterium]